MSARACMWLVGPAALGLVLAGCGDARPPPSSAADPPVPTADGGASPPGATTVTPASSSALPPPTARKAGCLDSAHGAKHVFVGKLEKHPDGSGHLRVLLPKKVCFGGGRFSSGDTDAVVLDMEPSKGASHLGKKVKVVGTSQDFMSSSCFPSGTRVSCKGLLYVMLLQVESLEPVR